MLLVPKKKQKVKGVDYISSSDKKQKKVSLSSQLIISLKLLNKNKKTWFFANAYLSTGYTHESWINHEEPPKYATLRSAAELARPVAPQSPLDNNNSDDHHHDTTTTTSLHPMSAPPPLPQRKSLSMCFTSTGTALSLPPKKKDIYRPYSLQPTTEIRSSPEEDLSAAQAILDLSASPAAPTHSVFIHTLSGPVVPPPSTTTTTTTVQPIPVSVLTLASGKSKSALWSSEVHQMIKSR